MTMTNQELTERCAKLMGVFELGVWDDELGAMWDGEDWSFAPLLDDGDAFRLAVKRGISIDIMWDGENDQYDPVIANYNGGRARFEEQMGLGFDDMAATRLAITRAAAQIHKDMEQQNG